MVQYIIDLSPVPKKIIDLSSYFIEQIVDTRNSKIAWNNVMHW